MWSPSSEQWWIIWTMALILCGLLLINDVIFGAVLSVLLIGVLLIWRMSKRN
jgi:uncharacterized membrane protein HdeD (DUF308 family)